MVIYSQIYFKRNIGDWGEGGGRGDREREEEWRYRFEHLWSFMYWIGIFLVLDM